MVLLDHPADERTAWIPSLGLDLVLRLDPLSLVLAVLVTGVGALSLLYCSAYLSPDAAGNGRLAGVLVAFAGAMLGLVLADSTMLLFVFWELTTVFSYLLVGHSAHRRTSRRAAMQALVVTTAGGLAMLCGLVVLGEQHSYLLSELVAEAPRGPAVTVAVALVLVGALSKSAIFPLHFWLPAAMAAPTPVSAYLHAAAMVKAGLYLVARLAPGFATVPGWRPAVLVLGVVTMLLGGWQALRQHDLKLVLAFGTVSQLGFLLVLLGAGTREAALAGVALLVAHALFKSALFLVVGTIDHGTGTRDLRRLSGVGRTAPGVAAVACLAAASMAGLPPLAGFVAKEAAFEAFSSDAAGSWSVPVLVALVAGSALTVAYSARFLWGALATKEGVPTTPLPSPPLALRLPPALLAAAGLVVGLLASPLDRPYADVADDLPTTADGGYHLALWHGLGLPLGLTAVVVASGLVLHRQRARLGRVPQGPGDADGAYRAVMRGLDRAAIRITVATQSGTLSTYLATILVVVLALPGTVLVVRGSWPDDVRLWDSPWQPVVCLGVVVAAVAGTRMRGRLAAVLVVGLTGYGLAVVFALSGAPDLALTQFLAETLTLVVFVLVLRKLPKDIVERHTARQRWLRVALAVPVGVLMAALGASALSVRTADPVGPELLGPALEQGGGKNVVNVALVDIRAWDTLGEISVLVVAATGVASLVFLRRRTSRPVQAPPARASHALWLRASALAEPRRRSAVLELVTRLVFHTVVVLSLYLLLAGHNHPGGGFAGGLVAGLALVLRYLAGGRYELVEAARGIDAGLLLGLGLLLAGGTGAAGLVLGGDVLESAIITTALPLHGDVKIVTSLVFDIGVYLVVLGLVLDVLRSLGAELDRREEPEEVRR